jgi:hypothetical protein
MSDLAAVLQRRPRPAESADVSKTLLTPDEIDALIAHSIELLRRTREDLGLRQE